MRFKLGHYPWAEKFELRVVDGVKSHLNLCPQWRARERTISNSGDYMSKSSVLGEFWDFLKVRKKFWLGPIILILLALGALIVFTEGSALAPFIYTLF